MSFVHLHVHSCYSLLDGAIRVEDLVKTAAQMGMPAVALTDHGQMMGLWAFYQAAKAHGVKPILGVETYVANHGRLARDQNESRYHLILLAQNLTGYRNLCRLISLANLEGFYNKPRVDYELMAEHSEGIVALSGCLQGELAQEILRGSSQERLKEIANKYSSIFKDRFYLELQENGLPQQIQVNEGLKELAMATSLPLVATNDCHYLLKEHHKAHDVLLCVQTHKKLTDERRMRMESEEFYFKSPQEMAEAFADCPEALANTLKIADSCNLEFPKKSYHFPTVPLPEGQTAEGRLIELAKEGLEARLAKMAERGQALAESDKAKYAERLDYELKVINQMGFPGYFLIVADFIQWAKSHEVMVGPGRGSAAGSLVAWALGVIGVDPIRYGLLFERFLNPERETMPDVDVDFCAEGRAEVIRHVAEAYGGREYVAQILALNQMKAKAVIRDVGRVLGMDVRETDSIAKLVPNVLGIPIDSAIAMEPRLAQLEKNDPRVKSLLDYARLLENLPRHASVHASGVVIGDRPLMEYLPLCRDSRHAEETGQKAQAITQYELKGVEENGLIKFDFLGLKTLTLIKHCLALLAKKGEAVDLEEMEFDDPKTFALLQSGQVNGVFQLESAGIRKVLVNLKPKTLEDISTLLALYRPGPIESGYVDVYVDVRHGRQKPPSLAPQADELLKETHGVIVYQEQVMRLAQVLAGFTLAQADVLRAAMGKKNAAKMAEMKVAFIDGAVERGLPKAKATDVFESMAKFAHYGFNKSHSLAYAVLAYWTAWLKAHHQAEFMAALLTSEMDRHDKLGRFIDDCRREGLTVRAPDVNASDYPFTVVDGEIVYGLGAIKGVGQGAVEDIVAARVEGGPFKDLFDFCQRVDSRKVNRRTMEALIFSGSFDQSGVEREVMMAALPEAIKAQKGKGKKKPEIGLFDALPVVEPPKAARWPSVEPMSRKEILNREKTYLGIYLSGHPLAPYSAAIKAFSSTTIAQAKFSQARTPVFLAGRLIKLILRKDKNQRDFAFAALEDLDDSIDLVVWNSSLAKCRTALESDALVWLSGSLEPGDERFGSKITVDEMLPLDTALAKRVKSLYFRAPLEELSQVAAFLKPILTPKGPRSPQVWLGVLDGQGEAYYRLDQSLEVSAPLLNSAKEAIGYFGEVRCLTQAPPFGAGRG
ncbi:MAG: DNA polymerase III subunit alpha [Deltaproteobacteria bacterium]|jgi:DNA polymerase-3 subunit alpha|nr:DNA polymerase III subunit alpha [Deltaproteobacteria bacterium]